jgi:hypothetical protein
VEVRLLRKTRWFLALTPSLYWKTMRRRRRVTTGGDTANECGVPWIKHTVVNKTVEVQADRVLLAQLVASGDVVQTDEYLFEVSGRLNTHWLWPNVVLEAFVFTPDMIINGPQQLVALPANPAAPAAAIPTPVDPALFSKLIVRVTALEAEKDELRAKVSVQLREAAAKQKDHERLEKDHERLEKDHERLEKELAEMRRAIEGRPQRGGDLHSAPRSYQDMYGASADYEAVPLSKIPLRRASQGSPAAAAGNKPRLVPAGRRSSSLQDTSRRRTNVGPRPPHRTTIEMQRVPNLFGLHWMQDQLASSHRAAEHRLRDPTRGPRVARPSTLQRVLRSRRR